MLLLLIHLQFLLNFFQQKDLSFQRQVIDDKISIGYGLAIGDVDGDKKPDILLADKKQFVWYRNGDWKRFVMLDNLTASDNVCIAARDLNGDGKVEVAVGAQWNPGETTDTAKSGSVHFLLRPKDPTRLWQAVKMHHEPTVHRMRWVRGANGQYFLIVVPLHGKGNRNGTGAGVKVLAYAYAKTPADKWKIHLLDSTMHLTHNFDFQEYGKGRSTEIYLAGKEGFKLLKDLANKNGQATAAPLISASGPVGEIRKAKIAGNKSFFACVQPMHGNTLSLIFPDKTVVLDTTMKEAHAIGVADFNNSGSDQVVVGWRLPGADGKVGIKMYAVKDPAGNSWSSEWLDENGMACEDLQVADLNGDRKPDIIASGRSTRNLVIYWNKN